MFILAYPNKHTLTVRFLAEKTMRRRTLLVSELTDAICVFKDDVDALQTMLRVGLYVCMCTYLRIPFSALHAIGCCLSGKGKLTVTQLLVLSTQEFELCIPSKNTTITLQTGKSVSKNGSMSSS